MTKRSREYMQRKKALRKPWWHDALTPLRRLPRPQYIPPYDINKMEGPTIIVADTPGFDGIIPFLRQHADVIPIHGDKPITMVDLAEMMRERLSAACGIPADRLGEMGPGEIGIQCKDRVEALRLFKKIKAFKKKHFYL